MAIVWRIDGGRMVVLWQGWGSCRTQDRSPVAAATALAPHLAYTPIDVTACCQASSHHLHHRQENVGYLRQ